MCPLGLVKIRSRASVPWSAIKQALPEVAGRNDHLVPAATRADATGLATPRRRVLSFDTAAETTVWLRHMHRADRRLVRPARGWSPGWPLARSTASALTRLGDREPMREFIAEQLGDGAGERANLNYWAFWLGDLSEQRTGDAFIGATDLNTWHGDRLLRHLMGVCAWTTPPKPANHGGLRPSSQERACRLSQDMRETTGFHLLPTPVATMITSAVAEYEAGHQ